MAGMGYTILTIVYPTRFADCLNAHGCFIMEEALVKGRISYEHENEVSNGTEKIQRR